MFDQGTVCALSTAPGTGGIAVVRLSGPDSLLIARACSRLRAAPEPRTAVLCRFFDSDGLIDEGLLTWFKAPASYTGEDMVELSIHGSPYIAQRLLQALAAAGARLALPGEFTQRAFLNRKLDLSQAEAVADLIASQSAAQHRLAIDQLRGGFSKRIEELRQQLIDFSALIELELDFSEEDVEFAKRPELLALIDRLLLLCSDLLASFRYGNAVRQGVPVAIVGAPNSGKSTLLNALLQDDRAIVSDVPGTTRDTVEETFTIGGMLFRLIDTAGLRKTSDAVEQMGIERSYRKASEASLVVLLGDASVMNEQAFATEARMLQERIGPGPVVLPVLNEMDLSPVASRGTIAISARSGAGLEELKQRFVDHVNDMRGGSADVVVTNARHADALAKAKQALEDARTALGSNLNGDLLAADLRRAQHHLGEIAGRIAPDDLLGSIFGRFCIGK